MARQTLIILTALVLAVPTASATWRAYGTYEPDNHYDSTSFMYFEPPVGTSSNIYFNAFALSGLAVNPNAGTLGTRNDAYGTRDYQAMLGQWTDCNQDGYVGFAEDALDEYPTNLLTADQAATLCIDGGANNADGWVTELRWIGYDYTDSTNTHMSQYDTRAIMDPHAVIWGDEGLYSDITATQGGSCPVRPVPRGTFHTIGGILNNEECVIGHRIQHRFYGVVLGQDQGVLGGNTQSVPGVDPTNSLGLAGPNRNDWTAGCADSTGSKIGCQTTFGEDDSSGSALTYSCSSTAPVWAGPVADQINQENTGDGHGQPNLKQRGDTLNTGGENGQGRDPDFNKQGPRAIVPGVNPANAGNVAATVNATNEAEAGDCNTSDDSGQDFYGNLQEGSNNAGGSAAARKLNPDHTFNFTAEHRGEVFGVATATDQPTANDVSQQARDAGVIKAGQPECFGLYMLEEGSCPQSMWFGGDVLLATRPGTRLDDEGGNIGLAGRHIATFYATVTTADGAAPGGDGVYGSDQCPIINTGAADANGWACDPAAWYHDAVSGQAIPKAANTPRATLGDHYQLRDVDCEDGQIVSGVPVFAGAGSFDKTCDVA